MSHLYPTKVQVTNFLKERGIDIDSHGFEDHWIEYDSKTDLNLWTDYSNEKESKGKECVTAYPIEKNNKGYFQTNTQTWEKIV